MQEYTFEVIQPADVYYKAKLKIKADSMDAARSFIENTPNQDLEDMCDEWDVMVETTHPNGPIQIWDRNGELIVGTVSNVKQP